MVDPLRKITPIHFVPRFCSQCGQPLKEQFVEEEKCDRLVCAGCYYIEYLNPKLVAGAILKKGDKIVLLRRGIEPAMGAWTYPAGFVELYETAAEAAVRETKEETGVDIAVRQMVGLYSYRDSGVAVIVYEAEITGGSFLTCKETSEIKEFSVNDIPWNELAFRSSRDALKDWIKKQNGENG